jgi:hypothetical protein
MVSAKDVINSIKPNLTKVPQGPTKKGSAGYDNIRDDIEKTKDLREIRLPFTPGSILFMDVNKLIAEDPFLFWDNTNKRLGVGHNAPLATLDVVGATRLGASTNTYTAFSDNGTQTMVGNARDKKHVIIPVSAATLGAAAPTPTVYGNYATLVFSWAVKQSAYVVFHTPDDWAVGTDMNIHAHWAPVTAAAGDVVWDIDYTATASEANEQIQVAGINLTVTDSTQLLIGELLQTDDMTISQANIAVNDAIGVCISRDTTDAADTYGAGVALVYLEITYTADKLGEAT